MFVQVSRFMISLHALLFLLMLELLPMTFNNKLPHDNIIENTQVSIFKTKESKERWKEMQIAKKKRKIKQEQSNIKLQEM